MVRTKNSGVSGVKSLGAKAPRKLSLSSSNSKSKSKRDSNSQGGGNSICHRETPQWQKPITSFFGQNTGINSVSQDNGNASLLNTDDAEIIPVEFCSVELNDSAVQDKDENITTTDDQKDNVPQLENDERNTKRKKDQGNSNDEGIYSEEEGIAIKKMKLSIVQTDSDSAQ